MKRVAGMLGLTVVLLAVALAGCGSPGDGAQGTNGGGSKVPTRTPEPSRVDTITADMGEQVSAGPWKVRVKSVTRGRTFGKHVADEGTLALVEVELTNVTPNQVPIAPRDFVVTDGESYTTALTEDPTYLPQFTVQPNSAVTTRVVFYLPPFVMSKPLTFVFQNAAVEMVRVEVPLP